MAHVGTAGWSIPRAVSGHFPGAGSHLERYAAVFDAVEINTSFHRPHRPSTYARWAASVPAGFRFAVKLPQVISHERQLVGAADELARFADEIGALGGKRGPVLIQLPPSLAFAIDVADAFLTDARSILGGTLACEPRHASWFEVEADRCLVAHQVARVAADPPRVPGAERPGGWDGLVYHRLHGSPQIYRSAYDDAAISAHAAVAGTAVAQGIDSWTIYDNTTLGHATANALALTERLTSAVI